MGIGDGNSMPQIQFGRFHFRFHFHFRGLGSNHALCDNGQVVRFGCRLIALQTDCRLAFAFSTSSLPSGPDGRPWSHHRTSAPHPCETPPSRLFLVQPAHLPVSALRSTCGPSRACASSRGRNPPTPTGGLVAKWWRSRQPLTTPRRNSRHKPVLSPLSLPLPCHPHRRQKGPLIHRASLPAPWPDCAWATQSREPAAFAASSAASR